MASSLAALLLGVAPVPSAQAQSEDACAASVDGASSAALADWRQPLVVGDDSTIIVAARSTEPVTEARLRLRLPGVSPVIWEEDLPRPAPAWVGEVPVGEIDRLGAGLHHIEIDAGACTMAFWISVERGSPLLSPLGLAGVALFVGGLVGAGLTLSAGARGTRRRGLGFVAGAAAGGGALLISHQFGQVPLTPGWISSWLVIPGVVGAGFQHVAQAASGGTRRPAPPGPEGRDGNDRDPPRESYALLDAPDAVVVGTPFYATVGLSPEPVAGVSGPTLRRPDTSWGAYDLTVQVVADGFTTSGDSKRTMRVTAEQPYPTFSLELVAEPGDADVAARAIHALYSVDGQTIGFAVRPVAVVASAAMLGTRPSTEAEGAAIRVPSELEPPDLTIRIVKGSTTAGQLTWSLESPHSGLDLTDASLTSDIGDTPEQFTRKLLQGVDAHEGRPTLGPLLQGHGRVIAGHVPVEVLDAIAATAALVGDRPLMVHLLSQEPYVPWELAMLEPPIRDDAPPFLGAQVELGRWVLGQRRPPLPAPTGVEVRALVVVGGDYDGVAAARLVEADAELAALVDRYAATGVEAFAEDILECLAGAPPADVLHFAVHGMYDTAGVREGLVLSDGSLLDPMLVKGVDLHGAPFVFLNACQVGSSNELLGDYSGVAEAFLFAGASGVVAPLWKVDDRLARELALTFYEAVLDGADRPAAALRVARSRFGADGEPPSATPLAYQFYGHPGLRLRMAAG